MQVEMISQTVQEKIEMASSDYDNFFHHVISEQERELTRALCCNDTFDTIFFDGDDIWLAGSLESGEFDAGHLGSKKDLVLYLNDEFFPGCDLEAMKDELLSDLSGTGIDVQVRGDVARSGAEWLTEMLEQTVVSAYELS